MEATMENILYCGDNLEILQKEIDKESVDLIYIDPPFFSHKQYEVIWGDEAEIRSFEDRWEGGVENYIDWMRLRVEAMYSVLKPTGSFYLHCDWHANAHLRIMTDKIFGRNRFQNEIIWHYKKWSTGKRQFQRNHDAILFYSKTNSKDRIFNQVDKMEKSKSTKKRFGDRKIISGYDKNGKRLPSQTKDEKSDKVARDDVWEISRIPPIKQLFPTQKPPDLLSRIIRASSNEGDIVLDSFCGCGTTILEAHKLKRKWIGIDISPTAIKLIEQRLRKLGAVKGEHYQTIGLPTTEKEMRALKPFEFQNWVIGELGAKISRRKVGDMGLNGHLAKTLWHERAGIQVKQSDKVGRNVVDNFETALRREKYQKGYIVAFSFTKGAYEESARVKNKGELEITLITVKELLDKHRILLK